MANYLGVDIGGTACKIGRVDENGQIYEKEEVSVNFDHYQTPILVTVLKAVKNFIEKYPYDYQKIGVSATGQVDCINGIVIGTAGHIDHYIGSKIKQEMEETFHIPTSVMNDANCMLLGEVWKGKAKGVDDVVAITLGTGVGGGIITGGKLLTGRMGIGGELGHMSIHNHGKQCYCGGVGCYELYASTTALVKNVSATLNQEVDGRWIFTHLDQKEVKEILEQWIDDIGAGLISLVHIFNPSLILIGGGVSAQEENLIVPLREKVLNHIMPRFADGLRLESAALKNDAGLLGAVYFALTQGKDL